jgi:long-chain acyl-CoA synthetase
LNFQLETHHIEELITELTTQRTKTELTGSDQVYIRMLMNQLTILTKSHPSKYYHIRHDLTCWKLLSSIEALNQTAANSVITLTKQFKEMIGDIEIQSVDEETGSEYSWIDLIEFDKTIEHEDKKFLLNIFQTYPIVKESIFLMTGFKLTHLENIQEKGIWITPLNTHLQIKQFRILTNLKDGNAYNFILYHLPKSTTDDLKSMIEWQIVKSDGLNFTRLTNNYLCSYPDAGIIISEYEDKSNVDSYLRSYQEELNNPKLRDRWDMRWLHFGWSGFQGYINHWAQTGFKYSLMNPTMKNVIISEFDNSTNVRVKHSLLQESVTSNLNVIILLYEELIISTENRFKGLNRVLYWEIVFTCILQASEKEKGMEMLGLIAQELGDAEKYELSNLRILEFIEEVESYGYIPKSVIFAALRFQRWMDLNPKSQIETKFNILQELYHDYKLNLLYTFHPVVRLRYFLLTCFVDHKTFVAQKLFELSYQLYHEELTVNELESNIHSIANNPECSNEQKYFLTRLIYHHVDAADYAELISSASGQSKLDLVVNLKNKDDAIFTIRPPFKPKEIAQFHDLLLSNNLNAHFSEEHDFLIMFSANKTQVGGVFWKMIDEQTAHIEKIAIHKKFLNCGLGEMLMNEISQRVKKGGAKFITVGFMKMEYFQRLGFKSDESIAGLIKEL